MTHIHVSQLAYRGWQEQALRALSHGQYTGVIFTQNPAESVFVSRLLVALRSKGWDLDVLASAVSKDLQAPNSQNSAASQSSVSANTAMKPLIDFIINALEPHAQSSIVMDQAERIRQLEAQLAQVKQDQRGPKGAQDSKDVSITPKKSGKLSTSKAFEPSVRSLQRLVPLEKHTEAAVRTWVKKIQEQLDSDQAAKLNKYIEDVISAHDALKKSQRPSVSDLAVQWGLPGDLVRRVSNANLLKVCATAAFMTS